MSKIDYNELVEFVRTHDEYYVAEFMFADNKRIVELEQELAELKEKAIVPRFKRQEIVYCFSYGKLQLFNVVAYLDNMITVCENRDTGRLEFVDNNFLCKTEQEAQTKLQELRGGECHNN